MQAIGGFRGDEMDTGDMWNSNSVVSWVLTCAGLLDAAGEPPPGGRAPGWQAGVVVARREPAPLAEAVSTSLASSTH